MATAPDYSRTEGAAIYRGMSLREREAARVAHLLHARGRTIGMDVAALEAQVAEKAAAAAAARDAEAAHAAAVAARTAAAEAIAHRTAAAATAERVTHAGVWAVQRDKTLRREWDLSDPARVRTATLPRDTAPLWATGDRGHPSSLQTFDAELLDDPAIPAAKRADRLAGLDAGVAATAATLEAAAAEARCVGASLLPLWPISRRGTTPPPPASPRRATAEAATAARAAAEAIAAETAAAAAAERLRVVGMNDGHAAARRAREAADKVAHADLAAAHVDRELANPFLREDTRLAVSAADPKR